MSHGLYDQCECGHVHPEHSLFGTCRGCLDCAEQVAFHSDADPADDHDYRQCDCPAFSRVAEVIG